jgi:large subunit ribosomal protein L14
MIHEKSKLTVADNSGAKLLEVIRVLGGTKRRYAYLADIVVASVKACEPRSSVKKGDVVRAVLVRTRKEQKRKDGSAIRFDDNAAVIVQKENKEMVGTRVFGPIAREIRAAGFKKIVSLAPEVW